MQREGYPPITSPDSQPLLKQNAIFGIYEDKLLSVVMPHRGLRGSFSTVCCVLTGEIKSAMQFWAQMLQTRCRWGTLQRALRKGCSFRRPWLLGSSKAAIDCFQYKTCNATSDHPSLKGIGKTRGWGGGHYHYTERWPDVNQGAGSRQQQSREGAPRTTRMRSDNRQMWRNLFHRAGTDGMGGGAGGGSLCAVLGSDRLLLGLHGFQCFELLGMLRAFVVGRSLALQRRTNELCNQAHFSTGVLCTANTDFQ